MDVPAGEHLIAAVFEDDCLGDHGAEPKSCDRLANGARARHEAVSPRFPRAGPSEGHQGFTGDAVSLRRHRSSKTEERQIDASFRRCRLDIRLR